MSRCSFLTRSVLLILPLAAALAPAVSAPPADDLMAQIKAHAARSAEATETAQAWKKLVDLGPESMPTILAGMDGKNAVVSNWLRTAVDAIGEKALKDGRLLPAKELEAFVADHKQAAAARRLAYEWLVRLDKTTPDHLLPGMLNDPSAELRRDAVARVIKEAEEKLERKDQAGAKAAFQKALASACDEDQVKAIADGLQKLGVSVDLAAHYGFILKWQLLTPFDNSAGDGFSKVYPPEKGVDLMAVYKGKAGEEARWRPFVSSDPFGKVDLNVIFGHLKGTIAYAYAVIEAPEERTAQLRVGSFNALKMFVNGKEVFARDEYHHGMRVDQHNTRVHLQKGRNEVLLKICQNEQTENWAQSWIFQARLCDEIGAAIPVKNVEVKP